MVESETVAETIFITAEMDNNTLDGEPVVLPVVSIRIVYVSFRPIMLADSYQLESRTTKRLVHRPTTIDRVKEHVI